MASESDATPVVSYTAHLDSEFTAGDLGVNDILTVSDAVPALPDPTAPTAVHESAPVLPAPIDEEEEAERLSGLSLAELVAEYSASTTPNPEAECLARAVYFESRGEPLAGQITVAEVILNRRDSRRFPSTICGVVRQPAQFSFVRRGHIPQPPTRSRQWRTAVAIARIAMEDLADGGAPRALFFHARRVNPRWRLTRIATVGNHVFYR